MSWWRSKKRTPQRDPDVVAAIERAHSDDQDATKDHDKMLVVSKRLRDQRQANHFAEDLARAYRGR